MLEEERAIRRLLTWPLFWGCDFHYTTNDDNAGVSIKFSDRTSLSVRWGKYSYCSRYAFSEVLDKVVCYEVAIIHMGDLIKLINDTVAGYQTLEEVLMWAHKGKMI